jgi:phage tail sheath gpL-like
MIKFDAIPSSIRKPGQYIEFNTRLAARSLPAVARKLLLIGQKLAAGSKAAETPVKIYSDSEAADYFGAGSVAHAMAKAAIKANPYADITVIAPADGAESAQAVGAITVSGTATSTGVLKVRIGADITEISIASGALAAAVGAALETALGNKPYLPVTADDTAGAVALTAKNKGTLGNSIGLAAESSAPGITVAVTAMATGAVDPSLTATLAAVQGTQFDLIVSSLNLDTPLGALKTHLAFVSGPIEQRPGIGVYAYTGAIADALSLAAGLNEGRLHCAYLRGAKNLSWELAAAEAAVMASESDPARPLNGLAMTGISAPEISDRFSRTEQESCLAGGVTPLEVNASGDVGIVRAVTTYTKTAAGIADPSLLDVTTITTLDYVRAAVRSRIALRFPREKLNDRIAAAVRTEIYAALKDAEALEIVEKVDANADGLIVERDTQDVNRLNAAIPADVVNGLHVFAGRIDLVL